MSQPGSGGGRRGHCRAARRELGCTPESHRHSGAAVAGERGQSALALEVHTPPGLLPKQGRTGEGRRYRLKRPGVVEPACTAAAPTAALVAAAATQACSPCVAELLHHSMYQPHN